MPKAKVPLYGNVAKAALIETSATIGATLGVDFNMPNGSLATKASLLAYLGLPATGQTPGITAHRLLEGLALGDDHPQYTRKDTLTTRGDLYVRNSTTVTRKALGTNLQLLRSDGLDPQWATISPTITLSTDLSGNTTLTNLGNGTLAATIVNNAVTDAKLRDSAALSVIGRASNTSGDPADIASSGSFDVLRRSGTAIGFGTIDHTYISDFDEAAQDAVGNMFVDSAEINFTYDDSGAQVTADLVTSSVAFTKLQNIATSRILGRVSASTGVIEALTGAQAAGIIAPSLAANPTASVGLTAVNGSANTFLRSDAAPALDQGIAPTWSGTHTFSLATSFSAGTVGSPGIYLGSDTASGLYRIGANNIAVSINGILSLDFSAARTLSAKNLSLSKSQPILSINDSSASADNRLWRIYAIGEQFVWEATNDAVSVGTPFLTVDRTGTTLDSITVGCPLYLPSGVVGSPSYTFTGDADTGTFRIGANNMGIAAGAVKQFDISDTRVDISPTLAAASLKVFVGLEAATGALQSATAVVYSGTLQMIRYAGLPGVIFNRVNGTIASPTAIVNNDQLYRLEARGASDTTPTMSTGASIVVTATENWSSTALGAKVEISTVTNGATANTARARFDSKGLHVLTGVVGIPGYTVATLPAGVVGDTAYVTNALAPAFGAVVAGGGAVTVPVFYDGTNWIVG